MRGNDRWEGMRGDGGGGGGGGGGVAAGFPLFAKISCVKPADPLPTKNFP